MSRAFVKDDAPDGPPIVPPRRPLPDGVPNYVTPRGLRLLREEREELEKERAAASASKEEENERKRLLTVVNTKLAALAERISTARVVRPQSIDTSVARFGASVTIRDNTAKRTFQIVGVDEADADAGRVAFVSPIARAVLGKKVGETVELSTPQGTETLTICHISREA